MKTELVCAVQMSNARTLQLDFVCEAVEKTEALYGASTGLRTVGGFHALICAQNKGVDDAGGRAAGRGRSDAVDGGMVERVRAEADEAWSGSVVGHLGWMTWQPRHSLGP